MIKDLVQRNRSVRRFHQDAAIELDTLKEFVNLARLTPSVRNLQPLKYMLSNDADKNSLIFPCLAWAGYFQDWPGPEEGERPSAYIIMLGDNEITKSVVYDHGIAAQTIMLGATEQGLGGCILALIQKEKLRQVLEIPPQYEILLVLALGKPKEKVVLERVGIEGDIRYWRDSDGVHHVPKRNLEDIII